MISESLNHVCQPLLHSLHVDQVGSTECVNRHVFWPNVPRNWIAGTSKQDGDTTINPVQSRKLGIYEYQVSGKLNLNMLTASNASSNVPSTNSFFDFESEHS